MAVPAVRIIGRGLRHALLVSTACTALAVAPAAHAAERADQVAQSQEAAQRFNVPPQSLDSALTAFADQAGFKLLFAAPAVRGLSSPGLTATATPTDALNRLLSGSGFTWRFTGPRTVTLEKVAVSGAVVLDPVTVQAGVGRESATGPVPGYVAKRASGATKSDTPLVETPQSISVVGAEELKARGAQTLEDAIKYTPGVVLSYGSVGDSRSSWFKMRGFPVTTTYYRDGLKVTGQSWQRIDPSLMERIEILRGPASVMYGQSVPGGLINMVTKRPQDTQSAEVAVEYGSNDWKRVEGDITGPLDQDKQLLYRITAAVQDSNGLNGIDHDRADRKMIAPSLTWKPQEGTSVTLAALYQTDDSRGWTPRRRYSTVAGGTTDPKIYLGEPDYDRYQQEQTQVTLLAEHAVNENLKFIVGGRYAKYDLDYRQVWPGSFQANGRTMNRAQYVYGQDAEIWSFDARTEGKFSVLSTEHTLVGGVDYSYQDMKDGFGSRSTETTINPFNPVYGRFGSEPAMSISTLKSRMLGVYLQDQIAVTDNLIVMLGGRRDFPGLSSGLAYQNAYTGRFGVAYKTDIGVVPYASYAESFEPQSGTGWGGTRFEPTTGRQYEIGVKYEPPGTNLLATVALFDLRKQNALTPDPDITHLCNGARCSVQTGEVKSQGVELGLTMELAQGLKGVAAYTYNPIEVSKSNTPSEIGRQQSDQPIHTASLWLDYGIQDGPLAGVGVGGGLRYVGKTTNNSSNVTTAAYVMDEMMVRYSTEAWRLSVNVRNLLDRQVEYSCTKSATQEMCYLNEPLTVTARVSRKF